MAVIQTRTFLRIADVGDLTTAVQEVEDEVNTFTDAFTDISDVLDIQTHTGPAGKYGERMLHRVTIVYRED